MKQQKVFCYIHSFVLIILINLNSCADKNPETLTSQFFGESEFDLSILQPHGGESFPKGGTCLIQWQNKKKFDNVDIELYKGDENLGNIVSAASDVGEFIWEISTSIDVSNNYKIKIIGSSSNSRVFIFSKTFSIYEPPLTLLYPNGGETLKIGNTDTIRWIGGSNIYYIKLSLWNNQGAFRSIDNYIYNDGTYAWSVPTSLSGGNDYKIKIMYQDDTTKYDFSDNKFTIYTEPLTLVTPNGGEALMPGKTYKIEWVGGINFDYVNLELWSNNSFIQTITSQSYNEYGYYNWTIPTSITNGSNYKIKLLAYLSPDNFDLSDSNFAISTRALKVYLPNGGETYVPGRTYPIYWDGGTVNGSVRIDLYRGTSLSQQITSSTSYNLYEWTVPTSLTRANNYFIKITQTATDLSDNAFSIDSISNPQVNQYEPNENRSQAYGPLLDEHNYVSFIGSSSDVDYYYFDVTRIKHVRVYLTVPSGVDYDLRVELPDGTSLATSTGSGNESVSLNLNRGTYYIKVYGYSGSASGTLPYNLFFLSY